MVMSEGIIPLDLSVASRCLCQEFLVNESIKHGDGTVWGVVLFIDFYSTGLLMASFASSLESLFKTRKEDAWQTEGSELRRRPGTQWKDIC